MSGAVKAGRDAPDNKLENAGEAIQKGPEVSWNRKTRVTIDGNYIDFANSGVPPEAFRKLFDAVLSFAKEHP